MSLGGAEKLIVERFCSTLKPLRRTQLSTWDARGTKHRTCLPVLTSPTHEKHINSASKKKTAYKTENVCDFQSAKSFKKFNAAIKHLSRLLFAIPTILCFI
jgi:hypothetical protein